MRRYLFSDSGTGRPLVIVEAANDDEALARVHEVRHQLDSLPTTAEHWCYESVEEDYVVTVPQYLDGYFIVLESSKSVLH